MSDLIGPGVFGLISPGTNVYNNYKAQFILNQRMRNTIKADPDIQVHGLKSDQGKPRHDLIHPSTLHALATVLEFGARKYTARNWQNGIAYGRVFGAVMRHLWAWWGGENTDKESGHSHLWHAATNLHFLIAFEAGDYADFDDRSER
jgi:Domain of unknown function (DUF5664)